MSTDFSPPSSPERVDFKVEITLSSRWMRVPYSFSKDMVASRPSGLWLRSEGCPHGPIWVAIDFSENNAMYLEKGWKTFLRSKNISEGRTIIFSYDGDETLWAKFFDSDGDRVDCCFESASKSYKDFHPEAEEATIKVESEDDD